MKIKLVIIFVAFNAFLFTSCREEVKEENVVREVEITKENNEVVEKENEGFLERTAKKVDTEVNKEIDEEIEKIGDDN